MELITGGFEFIKPYFGTRIAHFLSKFDNTSCQVVIYSCDGKETHRDHPVRAHYGSGYYSGNFPTLQQFVINESV